MAGGRFTDFRGAPRGVGPVSASLPWSIQEARDALAASSLSQRTAENTAREAVKTAARAEEAYRKALAETILKLRADGLAATVAQDVARGETTVAKLRYERDVAEGMREVALQAGWRASADRKDAQALSDWSMRRELAEARGRDPEPPASQTFGARAA